MKNQSQSLSQETYIERCPHDAENPYAQISRALLRDQDISPECRWMLSYLLSMDRGWKISAKQIWNHSQGFLGIKKVYKLIKEACEAGYMKRVYITSGNLKSGVKYYLSEVSKFKDSNNFSDVAVSGTSKTDASKTATLKKEQREERTYIKNPPLPPPFLPPTKEEEEEISKRIRERPKDAARIVSMKKYREIVLQDIRNESKAKETASMTIGVRRLLAESWDGKKFNGMDVVASREYVEFTHASFSRLVRYDVSEEEWKNKTGW